MDKQGADDLRTRAARHMREQWPPVLRDEPLADSLLDNSKGKVISKLMVDVGVAWNDKDCVDIAEEMKPDEVHPEVREKLDRLAEELDLAAR